MTDTESDGESGVTGLPDGKQAAVFKSVLEASSIATIVLGPDFTVQWVNEQVEEYFGISREEFIGSDKETLIDSTIKSRFERPDRYAETVIGPFETNTAVESFECHLLPGEDRSDRWLEHRSKPIESGELAGLPSAEDRRHMVHEAMLSGYRRTAPDSSLAERVSPGTPLYAGVALYYTWSLRLPTASVTIWTPSRGTIRNPSQAT